MSSYPVTILNPAPRWDPDKWDDIVLYHGTTRKVAIEIMLHGIDTAYCRPNTDFGPGFYLTSLKRQARHWAWLRYYPRRGALPGGTGPNGPVVMKFVLSRQALAKLDALQFFVRGSYDDEDYWSFVQHCRQNPAPTGPPPYSATPPNVHRRTALTPWYDIVAGPVASAWEQRQLAADSDQISFHTDKAVAVLKNYIDAEKKKTNSTLIETVA
ncbi:MAG TPA: DUF3990 domain-containing protein [Tepidisphaeraceae bacterium]|jgi:hypothetical protein|nr:DUF3990 domain-containing protein [Tepidisphaeraceae bacterium]